MDFAQLVLKARSFRRFKQSQRIAPDVLLALVNLARQVPSGGNRQPLRYKLVDEPQACARLFAHLRWAAAFKGWSPADGERPAAYVMILTDTTINKAPDCDAGIAAQTLQLAAAERGLGACMLGSIDRAKVVNDFKIPERYAIVLILALGVPAETVVLEDAKPGADVTYYRDEKSVHHVPKRPLQEVVLRLEA